LPHVRREADVPDSLVVATPVGVKREEAAPLEVLVVEPSADSADITDAPRSALVPASSFAIDALRDTRRSATTSSAPTSSAPRKVSVRVC
jgi:hypothetical protein